MASGGAADAGTSTAGAGGGPGGQAGAAGARGGGDPGGAGDVGGEAGDSGTERCPRELTVCGAACVDTRFDPAHCGDCDERCELESAVPACVDGRCVVARCIAGYVDQDGDPANGCEAQACQVVDTLNTVGSGALPKTCEDDQHCPSEGCCQGIAECSADGSGGIRFSFDICSDDRKWAVCDFNGVCLLYTSPSPRD